jgi:hypothetical protein
MEFFYVQLKAITLFKDGSFVPKTELYDKYVYQISFQYVHPVWRKWTETEWTDRQTDYPIDSSKAICPQFFEGGICIIYVHNAYRYHDIVTKSIYDR